MTRRKGTPCACECDPYKEKNYVRAINNVSPDPNGDLELKAGNGIAISQSGDHEITIVNEYDPCKEKNYVRAINNVSPDPNGDLGLKAGNGIAISQSGDNEITITNIAPPEGIENVTIEDIMGLTEALDEKADATALNTHVNHKTNPHNVTKAQIGLGNVDNTSDVDKPISTAVQNALDVLESEISTHTDRGDNPHGVTKAQVGLGNVDNTSDADKPISTAVQNALDGKVSYITNPNFAGGIDINRILRMQYNGVGDIEFNREGVERHHLIRADNDKVSVHPVLNGNLLSSAMTWNRDGGVAYATCSMRSSPGTWDVVNVGYINSQVANLNNYFQKEVAKITEEVTAKVVKEVTTKVIKEVTAKMTVDSMTEENTQPTQSTQPQLRTRDQG